MFRALFDYLREKSMVDLIIPVYKPQEEFVKLLRLINRQTVKVRKIILMNTEKEYWDDFLEKYKEVALYDNLEIHHITKFTHKWTTI